MHSAAALVLPVELLELRPAGALPFAKEQSTPQQWSNATVTPRKLGGREAANVNVRSPTWPYIHTFITRRTR